MRKLVAVLLCLTLTVSGSMILGINTYLKAEADTEGDYKASDFINIDDLYGWATLPANGVDTTSGGGNTKPVVVTDFESLQRYVQGNEPRVIVISGTINSVGIILYVGSNKTIVGMDSNAKFIGDICVENECNVIISNFNIQGAWPLTLPADGIQIKNSHHVWVNHMNIWDAPDGNLDIVTGSDYVTVSWCKFWYTSAEHEHRLSNLISSGTGNDTTDMGKLHVTYHHNWFADNVDQRQPRCLYGRVHVYNDYYSSQNASYCIASANYAAVLVENNYFNGSNNPHEFMYAGAYPASIVARGNVYNGTKGAKSEGSLETDSGLTVELFSDAPYQYMLDEAEDVPEIVTKGAGPKDILTGETHIKSGVSVSAKPSEKPEIVPISTHAPYTYDNPVTYDADSDTYTYHGQNQDGSNGGIDIPNPFKGMDFSEVPSFEYSEYPYWSKGITLSYWLYMPTSASDAPVFNFNLLNDSQSNLEGTIAHKKALEYTSSDNSYSLGTVKTYYSLSGKKLTVIADNGINAIYSPEFPEEGCYKISPSGSVPAYPESSDGTNPDDYVYLSFIGNGMYNTFLHSYSEGEVGQNSLMSEILSNGSFSLYTSGSAGFTSDSRDGMQINPNISTYGMVDVADGGNQFVVFGNGGMQTNRRGTKVPTMTEKGSWHFVVHVVQNDWVKTYMDGVELDDNYMNYFGYALDSSNYFDFNHAKGYSFNRGFGPRLAYLTASAVNKYAYARTIMDIVTDPDTVLTIGGTGVACQLFSQNRAITSADIQVKNVKAYPVPLTGDYVSADKITSYVDGFSIQGDKIVVVKADDVPEPTPVPTATPRPTSAPTATPKPTGVPTETPSPDTTPVPNESQMPDITEAPYKQGDVDMDGAVNAKDALAILKHTAKIELLEESALEYGDLNKDSAVNSADALIVLKLAARVIDYSDI